MIGDFAHKIFSLFQLCDLLLSNKPSQVSEVQYVCASTNVGVSRIAVFRFSWSLLPL